jgi:hypothetical protein
VNAALASHYSTNKEIVKKETVVKQAANDDQIKQEVISAAVQAAVINA